MCLPLLVPGFITAALWAMPGNPAEIICPPQICDGTAELAARFHLDKGPFAFYKHWLVSALSLDFGNSWRVQQGATVNGLILESLPRTAQMVAIAMTLILSGVVMAAAGWMPRKLDPIWQAIGIIPAVIGALLCAAWVTVTYGALSVEGWPATLRVVCGGVVLGIADGALASAIVGTRSVFETEFKQRYIQIAVLRGETPLANALPNILPSLIGQLRGRAVHLLSAAVIVEVVMQVPGLGELLWDGTLKQDFAVVMAAAWAFSLLSGGLMFSQAVSEIALAWWVRRAPRVTS
jgi:peptide/nickel transport system permease protein